MTLAGRYLTLSQAAAFAGVTRQSAHAWLTAGVAGVRLRAEVVGGRILIRRSELVAFLRKTGRVATLA